MVQRYTVDNNKQRAETNIYSNGKKQISCSWDTRHHIQSVAKQRNTEQKKTQTTKNLEKTTISNIQPENTNGFIGP